MMKWLRGEVAIQQDMLQNKFGKGSGGRKLATALNWHRGGSTGFYDAHAYQLVNWSDKWPDTYGCNHYRNAIISACYATLRDPALYSDDERIGILVQHV